MYKLTQLVTDIVCEAGILPERYLVINLFELLRRIISNDFTKRKHSKPANSKESLKTLPRGGLRTNNEV